MPLWALDRCTRPGFAQALQDLFRSYTGGSEHLRLAFGKLDSLERTYPCSCLGLGSNVSWFWAYLEFSLVLELGLSGLSAKLRSSAL